MQQFAHTSFLCFQAINIDGMLQASEIVSRVIPAANISHHCLQVCKKCFCYWTLCLILNFNLRFWLTFRILCTMKKKSLKSDAVHSNLPIFFFKYKMTRVKKTNLDKNFTTEYFFFFYIAFTHKTCQLIECCELPFISAVAAYEKSLMKHLEILKEKINEK